MRLAIASKWVYPFKLGGIEKYSMKLAKGLVKRGVKTWVITTECNSSTAESEPKILSVNPRFSAYDAGFLDFYSTTYGACKRLDFDLIIIQNAGLDELLSSLAARQCGIPIVLVIHGLPFTLSALKPGTLIARLTARNARRIIVVSPYIYNFLFSRCSFLGISKEKVVVVPTAVDINKFDPHVDGTQIRRKHHIEDAFVILSVSRLAKVKGIEFLIQALKPTLNQIKNLKLLIVGNGPDEGRLRLIARKIGISDKVLFAGRVSDGDLPKYYAASDVFVNPSIHEGVPATILEAFASGNPVIATRVGGVPHDLIQDGKNGILVNPREPIPLSKAIINLFNDERKRRELGRSGREFVCSRHNWNTVVDSYLKICRKLVM